MTVITIKDEKHWHELRTKHVGGSEVAALFGACSYLTHLELWLVKRGDVPADIEDNDRMFWGRMVEDAIARGVSETKGWQVTNPKAYYICDDVPGMGCTPDRLVTAKDRSGPGLMQIKNVDRMIFSKWEDEQPPLQYELQLQHEMACTGCRWGILAVLVGGNTLKIYVYDWHGGAIAKIKKAVALFWKSIDDNKQPPAVADDYDILKELHPGDNHKVVDMSHDNQFPELCAQAIEAAERRKAADKEERQAKATILQKMTDAGRARCTGFSIKKTSVTRKEHVVKESTFNRLTIQPEEEKAA